MGRCPPLFGWNPVPRSKRLSFVDLSQAIFCRGKRATHPTQCSPTWPSRHFRAPATLVQVLGRRGPPGPEREILSLPGAAPQGQHCTGGGGGGGATEVPRGLDLPFNALECLSSRTATGTGRGTAWGTAPPGGVVGGRLGQTAADADRTRAAR
eukprot:gene15105-biopygen8143